MSTAGPFAGATFASDNIIGAVAWTAALINGSTFGVEVASIADLASTAQIDFISITVDWTGSNRSGNMIRQIKTGDGVSVSEGGN